jgi:hypothetical protein
MARLMRLRLRPRLRLAVVAALRCNVKGRGRKAPSFSMLDEDRIDAISNAIAEIESGMLDVTTILGTEVSLVHNSVLRNLEEHEFKYFELKKVLDKLDALTLELYRVKKGFTPSKEDVELYKNFRKNAIRILQGRL